MSESNELDAPEAFEFYAGDLVEKVKGDYRFVGRVLSAFRKMSGKVRYAVEDDRGIIHIFSKEQLRTYEGPKDFLPYNYRLGPNE